jgi:hypothetical protein
MLQHPSQKVKATPRTCKLDLMCGESSDYLRLNPDMSKGRVSGLNCWVRVSRSQCKVGMIVLQSCFLREWWVKPHTTQTLECHPFPGKVYSAPRAGGSSKAQAQEQLSLRHS